MKSENIIKSFHTDTVAVKNMFVVIVVNPKNAAAIEINR